MIQANSKFLLFSWLLILDFRFFANLAQQQTSIVSPSLHHHFLHMKILWSKFSNQVFSSSFDRLCSLWFLLFWSWIWFFFSISESSWSFYRENIFLTHIKSLRDIFSSATQQSFVWSPKMNFISKRSAQFKRRRTFPRKPTESTENRTWWIGEKKKCLAFAQWRLDRFSYVPVEIYLRRLYLWISQWFTMFIKNKTTCSHIAERASIECKFFINKLRQNQNSMTSFEKIQL